METILHKWGNSAVVILPPALLKALDLAAGQPMELQVSSSGQIILSKTRQYTLEKLIAMCDTTAPKPADLALWSAAKPVGGECW
ncbi:AbrB/MazE/SpoVT family DNA-binding domain-containing protein [Castellaniella sp.]|uniref:AbrB/MazE/SpoVT family DNA-binding domain-containing protein n=1 Tax=Castellaniella sp. TaxID=1955812 RepID=UPI003A8CA5D0